jgi:hypothetical protein
MSNHDLTGMNHHIDWTSIIGVVSSWTITVFGLLTLNEYAIFLGMGVAATAIGVNINKMVNQRLERKILNRRIEEKQDESDDEDDEPET